MTVARGAAAPHGSARDEAAVMDHALALGRRGLGRTWPNPAVGAVVWRPTPEGPMILGRGHTRPTGRPHAETEALKSAGHAARGAVMTVTLEPCSHHGRTPPCADAIVAAGIARVVTALEDPDPRVAGRGHAILRASGVAVETGLRAREAFIAHLGHIRRVTLGRPAVFLKLARTADGYAAAETGRQLMITGPIGSARVHIERATADAIMVGIGTVLADDPRLTCRLPGLADASPIRVVLDGDLRLPVTSGLVRTARDVPVWVITAEGADLAREAALRAHAVDVIRVPRKGRHLDLDCALGALGERGITRVMSEGGPTLGDALAAAGLVDEVTLITNETPLGRPGVPAVGPCLAAALADRTLFEVLPAAMHGPDRFDHFVRTA
jgi:diaminohydroxyphosphoribosylaminopyrimidine deaminase/5-amino-6-(5-phosphoribosylamino)uracil reductase